MLDKGKSRIQKRGEDVLEEVKKFCFLGDMLSEPIHIFSNLLS